MKKTKDYTLLAFFTPFAIAVLSSFPGCYSKKCDQVPYNGMDYQIILGQDSMQVYDGERFVGAIAWPETGKVDSLFLADNE